jgi:ABC-2 type transport system permease protein
LTCVLHLVAFQKSFARMTVYRAATVAGVVTNFFWGLLRAYVFIAVFRAADRVTIGGFTLNDSITYTALTQALIAPIYLWGWWDLLRAVRTGEIVTELTKPYDFYWLWMARDMGRATFQLLFRGLPILVVFPIAFDITWPRTPLHWLATVMATALAIMLSFAWRFLLNLSAFWFVDGAGIARLATLWMTFFSGFMVPVAMFPDWLRRLAGWTPLPSMVNTPIEVYLGLTSGVPVALLTQLGWLLVLTALCRALFVAGLPRVVSQGG